MNDFEQYNGDKLFEKIMIGVAVATVIFILFTL